MQTEFIKAKKIKVGDQLVSSHLGEVSLRTVIDIKTRQFKSSMQYLFFIEHRATEYYGPENLVERLVK